MDKTASPVDSLDPAWLMRRCVRGIAMQALMTVLATFAVVMARAVFPGMPLWVRVLLFALLFVEVLLATSNIHFLWDEYRKAKFRHDYFVARADVIASARTEH